MWRRYVFVFLFIEGYKTKRALTSLSETKKLPTSLAKADANKNKIGYGKVKN
jgi:hypothetical protein